MSSRHIHPYQPPDEVRRIVDRLHAEVSPIIHPQQLLEKMRKEGSTASQFNAWLADHIVGLAGTMIFFYLLCVVISAWALWQSAIGHNKGFDPFPYAFLFFVLGGIMQSLFVPTMLTASNRATERDRIKDEADHRAWSHLYKVNEEQLQILRDLGARLIPEARPAPPNS